MLFLHKIKDYLIDAKDIIIDYWLDLSFRKKLILATVSVMVVGGLLLWYFSPQFLSKKAENDQIALVKRQKIHNFSPNKKFHYNTKVSVPDFNTLLKQRKNTDNLTLRTELSIPKLKIDLPIYEGVSSSTLAWGGGTAKYGQVLGKRNYAVEAHNYIKLNYARNWFFSNLQTKIAPAGLVKPGMANKYIAAIRGMNIYAKDASNVYTYKVLESQIRNINNPMAADLLEDYRVNTETSSHKPLITLATCYEQYNVAHPIQRIVVTGELVKKQSIHSFKNNNIFNLKE